MHAGLIACDVVSHWSWNSVFLFIPTLFYDYVSSSSPHDMLYSVIQAS